MDERYPFLRFVIDAAQVIAGAVALIIVLGGTVRACGHGGVGGLVAFGITLAVAGVAYVAVRARIEVLQLLLDLDGTLRLRAAEPGPTEPPSAPRPAA